MAPASSVSCLARTPARDIALGTVGATVKIGERTFALAWRWIDAANVDSVIIGLDDRGELVETPVAVPYADPHVLGAGPDGLLVVSVPLHGTGTLLRIALQHDGTLVPGTAVPLPEVAWGWPLALVADGKTATLRHALASPDQTIDREVSISIDLASAKVTGVQPAPPEPESRAETGFPPAAYPQTVRHAYGDGVIEVAWDGGHGMAHSPTDTETRRYFEHWFFNAGQVRMLRDTGHGWTASDVVPLALHDATGTFDTGYQPVILRNGLHATILMAAGHPPASLQPYRVPCAARSR